MKILNFSFPFTGEQLPQLTEELGVEVEPEDVINIRANFNLEASSTPQVEALLEQVGFSAEEWATSKMVVNAPGMAWAAGLTVAGYAGLAGYMPSIIRLVQRPGEGPRVFDLAEVINLQAARDEARKAREEITDLPEKSGKVRVVNFSHPLTASQLEGLAQAVERPVEHLDVINIRVQLDPVKPFGPQVRELIDNVPLSSAQWQTEDIVFNLPGLAPAACLVLAEANGRMGYFPRLIRLKKADAEFVFAELLDPQKFRMDMRAKSQRAEARVVISGISVSEEQISQIAALLGIPKEAVRVS